ncbi:MAG: cation:proton antiporter, partial [Polyangiales bacterium]
MRAPVADAARLSSRPLRQATIIALLVAAMVFLARFRGAPTAGFDASALMAGGFIVLASYTIGQLVEVVRLPHITGYLLAGVLFGPSIAALLPTGWRVPPFDEGVLNHQVTGQLGLLNSLAIALIALTAGGELRLPALRRSLRTLLGLLGGQLVAIVLFVVALITVLLSSGGVLQLPGTTPLGLPAALALGAIVAAISFATSPAATIAIVNDTGARGSMTRSVMAA